MDCLTCGGSGRCADTKTVYNEITWYDCPDCNGTGDRIE